MTGLIVSNSNNCTLNSQDKIFCCSVLLKHPLVKLIIQIIDFKEIPQMILSDTVLCRNSAEYIRNNFY